MIYPEFEVGNSLAGTDNLCIRIIINLCTIATGVFNRVLRMLHQTIFAKDVFNEYKSIRVLNDSE